MLQSDALRTMPKLGPEPTRKLSWFPILMLHSVVDTVPRPNPSNLCISKSGLERLIIFLRRSRFRIVHLEAAIAAWQRGEPVSRLACLTFDDGYADFYTHAFPVLERHGAPATVFLVSDRLGGANEWDTPLGLPKLNLLPPRQVRELAAKGVRFGAHGATHRQLTTLSPEERWPEILGAKRTLEALLDREIPLFAYPYIDQDEDVQKQVAAAGYLAACGGEQPDHQPFLLHRVDIERLDPVSLRFRLRGWRYKLQASAHVETAKRIARRTAKLFARR